VNLSNNRVKLVRLDESDYELFVQLRTCPDIMEHIYTPFTEQEAKERFNVHLKPWSMDSAEWLSFTIVLLSTDEKVGDIGLKIVDRRNLIGEVGFMLKKESQGLGIGTQALSLIKELAFERLNLKALTAVCSVNNSASYSLLEKHDFARQECRIANTLINGQYVDDYVYRLENNVK